MERQWEKTMKNATYMVPALLRGLKILELLAEHAEGLSSTEMEALLAFPPATLYRILSTLTQTGYLTKDGMERHHLSRKLLSIGYRGLDCQKLLERALPEMRSLCDKTGESVLIASLYGSEGVVLEQCVSYQPVMVGVRIGHHFPLHTAAPGKALLAFLPEAERSSILNTLAFTVFTKTTIRTKEALEQELEQVRKEGVAFDRGEELEELRCVAAPVFDFRGYPAAAVSIGAPASRMGSQRMKMLALAVKESAAKIH